MRRFDAHCLFRTRRALLLWHVVMKAASDDAAGERRVFAAERVFPDDCRKSVSIVDEPANVLIDALPGISKQFIC